jgi:hypothetical protein
MLNVNPLTMLLHLTLTAPGTDWAAEGLAEGHEDIVDGNPPFGRQRVPEYCFGFIRRTGFYITEAVADTVHMGVHADPGLAESQCYDEIGRFPADARKAEKRVQVIRDFSIIVIQKETADGKNGVRLAFVKSHRIDILPDFSGRQPQHGAGSLRLLKEPA